MKTNYKFFAALLAMAFFAGSAFAQQQSGARRNGYSNRDEAKVERKQSKVDNGQRPTNINNQNATDKKVRDSQNNNGRPSGNNNYGYGNRPSNGGHYGYGNHSANNNRPSNGGHDGYSNHSGNNNRPSSGNHNGYGNSGNNNRPPMPPGGFGGERGRRPEMAPIINYSSNQIYERTNAYSIVINTIFRTKKEAYDYIERLLDRKSYTIASYGNNYNWLQSDVEFVPTPFDWTNPMTHNQFRMKFNIYKSGGAVRVVITGQWRESYLSNSFTRLRFQPSNRYSTYYAWNVLEDFALSIPNNYIYYN